jgi:hypothetical protein
MSLSRCSSSTLVRCPVPGFGKVCLLLAACALLPEPGAAQVDQPFPVSIRGDTVADEGQRVSWSIVPWTGAEVELAPVFHWTFGDGGRATSRAWQTAVGYRYMQDGDYTVTVSDGSNSASLQIRVEAVRPSIEVLSHVVSPGSEHRVEFQALAWDPGSDTLTYAWDFGDGSSVRRGVDLLEPVHIYREPGAYVVELVVTDEDGLEDRSVLDVEVNPGFLGQLSGEVERPVRAESGTASLFNALPGSRGVPLGNFPLFTGAASTGGGVADLSGPWGVCFVQAGFWDDEHRIHVNFQWVVDADSLFVPKSYPLRWVGTEGDAIPPDQLLVNAMLLDMEPSYEDAKKGAEDMAVLAPGAEGLVGNLRGLLSALMSGGQPAPSPGRNWQLTGRSGSVRIAEVTPEVIRGAMDVTLQGAWLSLAPGGSGQVSDLRVRGSFAWELDEVARINLLRCGAGDFDIASHTPGVEAGGVNYERPKVSITFTLPVERDSVTEETVELGWLDSSGGFHRVPARIVHAPRGSTVHLVPDEPLDDAVYHKVRVRGGASGVRSIALDPLAEDYEWRFATFPELIKRPEREWDR